MVAGTTPHPLGSLVTGITHLREKGGASPQSLIDLQNGYVDQSGSPVSRFGTTFDVTLPTGTKGACAFKNKIHVFAMTDIDPGDDDYVVDILVHPNPEFTGTLVAIHFAKPYLGFLYVVAEFSDGAVYHFWLQIGTPWTADTVYKTGDLVAPTTPNGFLYKVAADTNPVVWQPLTQYAMGDIVQPTVYNGYKYTAVEVDGTNPSSGATEPAWPAQDGAQVTEDVDTDTTPTTTPTTPTGSSPAGPRYDVPNLASGNV